MQYGKKGFGEEENVSSSKEQKKLQRTGTSGWLVCAAILDCRLLCIRLVINVTMWLCIIYIDIFESSSMTQYDVCIRMSIRMGGRIRH